MNFWLKGHNYTVAVREIISAVLMSDENLEINQPMGDYLVSELLQNEENLTARAELFYKGKVYHAEKSTVCTDTVKHLISRHSKKIIKLSIFEVLKEITEITPQWGSLTGVRPARLSKRYLEEGHDEEETIEYFKSYYHVSEARAKLMTTCGMKALELDRVTEESDVSVYASIPFCPSRCYYCSFVSSASDKASHLIEPYVDKICSEMAEKSALVRQNYNVNTMYLGGGTPTILNPSNLERVMKSMKSLCPDGWNGEFTVEAGRPDTIDSDKLWVIKENGGNRISINPQSMNDEVLAKIGRRHTSEDIKKTFGLARDIGFNNINMDVIAGLEGDDEISFRQTLEKLIDLSPENITVHTLAVKKGANLTDVNENYKKVKLTEKMINLSWEMLINAGFKPYYTYRQKYMAGGFENIGWSKTGFDCVYNILMMEDIGSIMAFGAGTTSKIIDKNTGKMTRVYGTKYPFEYIK